MWRVGHCRGGRIHFINLVQGHIQWVLLPLRYSFNQEHLLRVLCESIMLFLGGCHLKHKKYLRYVKIKKDLVLLSNSIHIKMKLWTLQSITNSYRFLSTECKNAVFKIKRIVDISEDAHRVHYKSTFSKNLYPTLPSKGLQ